MIFVEFILNLCGLTGFEAQKWYECLGSLDFPVFIPVFGGGYFQTPVV